MRQGKRKKLFVKVFVGVFLMQVLLGVALILFLYKMMPIGYNTTLQEEIVADFDRFAQSADYSNSDEFGTLMDDFLDKYRHENAIAFLTDSDMLFDEQGVPNRKIYDSKSTRSIHSIEEYEEYLHREETENIENNYDYYYNTTSKRIYMLDGNWRAYMVVFQFRTQKENLASRVIWKYMPWFICIILTVALLSAWAFSMFFTRPIKRISEVAGEMSELNFDRKCNNKRKDEIGLIGESLDHLSSKLQRTLSELHERNTALEKEIQRANQLENQRSVFFSAAAHELKTPLSIVDGQLNGMIDQVGVYEDRDTYLRKSLANVRRMEKTVRDILAISRLQAGIAVSEEKISISKVINELMDTYEELYDERSIVPEVSVEEGLYVQGNYELIKDALGALLSNAYQYSPKGADVYIRARKQDERITIEVENNGVHIPDEHLSKLHEAFYRTDKSRNSNSGGSGLGLYLVKLVAESQGGACAIRNTEKGVLSSISFRSI